MTHLRSMPKKVITLFSLVMIFATGFIEGVVPNGTPLDSIAYSGASVLPIVESEGVVLLGREAGGKHRGLWDSWGGSRDENEFDCKITAAREFFEEAILGKTLGWDLSSTEQFIDPANQETTLVIAKELQTDLFVCLFHTTFTTEQKNQLIDHFAYARQSSTSWKYLEKDGIALVNWDDLAMAVLSSSRGDLVNVKAHVTYPSNQETIITLRPYLVSMLRPYIEDHAYHWGHNPKVRYYR